MGGVVPATGRRVEGVAAAGFGGAHYAHVGGEFGGCEIGGSIGSRGGTRVGRGQRRGEMG